LQLHASSEAASRQVQNTKLRVLLQLLNCYSVSLQLGILDEKLDAFQLEENDRGVSVLTSVFYKALFKEAVKSKNVD